MVWKNDVNPISTYTYHIIFMIYFKYANKSYQPFLFAPTCFLFVIFLTSGFLLHVIVGAGWPLAEQKNFACPPSLTLMSLELNLSDISGGTTTSNVATCECQKRVFYLQMYMKICIVWINLTYTNTFNIKKLPLSPLVWNWFDTYILQHLSV